jgi:hypothetical protein
MAGKHRKDRGINTQLAQQYGDPYRVLGGLNGERISRWLPPRLTTARSEGTASDADARDYGSYGYSTRHDDIRGD